jgi:hypothetical protein
MNWYAACELLLRHGAQANAEDIRKLRGGFSERHCSSLKALFTNGDLADVLSTGGKIDCCIRS